MHTFNVTTKSIIVFPVVWGFLLLLFSDVSINFTVYEVNFALGRYFIEIHSLNITVHRGSQFLTSRDNLVPSIVGLKVDVTWKCV